MVMAARGGSDDSAGVVRLTQACLPPQLLMSATYAGWLGFPPQATPL